MNYFINYKSRIKNKIKNTFNVYDESIDSHLEEIRTHYNKEQLVYKIIYELNAWIKDKEY